jgi:hypothetical protein
LIINLVDKGKFWLLYLVLFCKFVESAKERKNGITALSIGGKIGHFAEFVSLYNIGLSEVRALPVRRCRRAAWQTKWPLSSLLFSPLPLLSVYALLLFSQRLA